MTPRGTMIDYEHILCPHCSHAGWGNKYTVTIRQLQVPHEDAKYELSCPDCYGQFEWRKE